MMFYCPVVTDCSFISILSQPLPNYMASPNLGMFMGKEYKLFLPCRRLLRIVVLKIHYCSRQRGNCKLRNEETFELKSNFYKATRKLDVCN